MTSNRFSFTKFVKNLENINTRINNAFANNTDSSNRPCSSGNSEQRAVRPSPKVPPWLGTESDRPIPQTHQSTTASDVFSFSNLKAKIENAFTSDWDTPTRQSSPPSPTSSQSTSHCPPVPPRPNQLNRACATGSWSDNATPNYFHPGQGECLKCMDFRIVDEHAAKFPREFVKSIAQLAIYLGSNFSSNIEKARAIFIWLHHNIAYNAVAFFSGQVTRITPEETLQSGLAVCQGFAELFAALGKFCGLDVLVISGHGKGYGYVPTSSGNPPQYSSNHAWNAVRLDNGEWHYLDSCWGAGYLDGQCYVKHLSTKHFTSSAEEFYLTHFPENRKYQQMGWSEYILMKEGPLIYANFGDYGFSESTILPKERFLRPEPTTFVIRVKCEHSFILPKDRYVILLSVDGVTTPFQVDSQGTIWTCYSQWIRPGSEVAIFALDQFGGTSAKGIDVQEYLKPRGGSTWSTAGLCKWDA